MAAAADKLEQRHAQRTRDMAHKYALKLAEADGAIIVVTLSTGGGQRAGRVRRTISGRPHADFAVGAQHAVAATPVMDLMYATVFKKTRRGVRAALAARRCPMTKFEADAYAVRKIVKRLEKLPVAELLDHAIAYGQYGVTLAPVPIPDVDAGATPVGRGREEAAEEDEVVGADTDGASAAAGVVPATDA